MVKRGQVMGTSGQTGMAGGDHIHFGMQLDGVQIDPKEWWDSHWINDHIAKRVDLPRVQQLRQESPVRSTRERSGAAAHGREWTKSRTGDFGVPQEAEKQSRQRVLIR